MLEYRYADHFDLDLVCGQAADLQSGGICTLCYIKIKQIRRRFDEAGSMVGWFELSNPERCKTLNPYGCPHPIKSTDGDRGAQIHLPEQRRARQQPAIMLMRCVVPGE